MEVVSLVAFEFCDLVGLLVVHQAYGTRLHIVLVIVVHCAELLFVQRFYGVGIGDGVDYAFPLLMGSTGKNYTSKEAATHAKATIGQKVHIAQDQQDHDKYPQLLKGICGVSACQSLVCELKRVPIYHPSNLELEYYAHIDGIKCCFNLFDAWSACDTCHDEAAYHVKSEHTGLYYQPGDDWVIVSPAGLLEKVSTIKGIT